MPAGLTSAAAGACAHPLRCSLSQSLPHSHHKTTALLPPPQVSTRLAGPVVVPSQQARPRGRGWVGCAAGVRREGEKDDGTKVLQTGGESVNGVSKGIWVDAAFPSYLQSQVQSQELNVISLGAERPSGLTHWVTSKSLLAAPTFNVS